MITKVSQTIASPAPAAPSASAKSQNEKTSFAATLASTTTGETAATTGATAPSLLALFSPSNNKPAANTAATAKAQADTSTQTTTATSKAASTESTAAAVNTAADTGGLIDFSPQAHENRMNSWLTGYVSRENQQKMEMYNAAMADWAVNEKQRQYLGLPSQPAPAAPQLAKAEAKPAGWWMSNGTMDA